MSRHLLFSDLHCSNFEQFSTRLPNGRNSRFQDCLDIIDQAIQIVREYQICRVFFLGDLFDQRHRIDVDVYTSTFAELKRLSLSAPLTIIRGNHDEYTRVGDVSSIEPLQEFARVVTKPQYPGFDITELLYNTFFLCPHLTSDQFREACKDVKKVKYFLGHQSISEGFIGPYNKTVRGEVSLTDLPFDKVEYFLFGDYHQRQFFGPENEQGKKRVHYIGSPLQLNFNEIGQTKAFTVIDDETDEFITVETNAPKFFKSETLQLPSEYRSEKDFLRLLITKKDLEEAEALRANNTRVQIVLVSEEQKATRSQVSFASSNNDLLFEYITKSNTRLEKPDLLELGLELLKV